MRTAYTSVLYNDNAGGHYGYTVMPKTAAL